MHRNRPHPHPAPGVLGVPSFRAADFAKTLAVNTHLDFGVSGATPQYADTAAVAAHLALIWGKSGLRPLLRDSPSFPDDVTLWPAFAKLTGARFVSYIGETKPADYQGYLDRALAMPGIIAYLEGPNEPDSAAVNGLTGGLSEADVLAAAAKFMPSMTHGLPVINMSFGQGWTADNNWHGNYDKVGDLSVFVNFTNAHTYPMAGMAPAGTIAMLAADALLAAPGRPVMHTEFGYTEDAAKKAAYTLAGWCDAFATGCPLFGIYALYDDMSGAWGLFAPDGSPRPVATALGALLELVADTGPNASTFTPQPLAFTAPGCASIPLACSDGTYRLLLWNEVAPGGQVTVTLGATVPVSISDPMQTALPPRSANSFTVTVPEYPIVVTIG